MDIWKGTCVTTAIYGILETVITNIFKLHDREAENQQVYFWGEEKKKLLLGLIILQMCLNVSSAD